MRTRTFQLVPTESHTYFVVAELTPDAASQTPNTFRITPRHGIEQHRRGPGSRHSAGPRILRRHAVDRRDSYRQDRCGFCDGGRWLHHRRDFHGTQWERVPRLPPAIRFRAADKEPSRTLRIPYETWAVGPTASSGTPARCASAAISPSPSMTRWWTNTGTSSSNPLSATHEAGGIGIAPTVDTVTLYTLSPTTADTVVFTLSFSEEEYSISMT